jgi:3-phosphoshikimate 1-carboxyvinyltransferase
MTRSVRHADRIEGVLKVPGDKSISHRSLILGAIARGKHEVEGAAQSADIEATARCLRELGCFVERMPDGRVLVLNDGEAGDCTLDCGNSGTSARLIAGMAAGLDITCTIDGDESLRRRPMGRIVEPLALMGADIVAADGATLPLRIHGGSLHAITYELPVASAQVKSAILIAGLFADGTTTVVEPVPTRDHTERMLATMGATVERDGNHIAIAGGQALEGTRIIVPGDFSSAAFFLVAASCLPGSQLFLPMLGVNPTRTGLLDVLASMGADIAVENETGVCGEPVGDVTVRSAALGAVTIDDPAVIASVIDEIPVIAVAATQADGVTEIRNARELRNKECDRIDATVTLLEALGADVAAHDDGLTVRGPSTLTGAAVESFGDHRIAMAAAVAGLIAGGETTIDDAAAVEVSYPEFFSDLVTVVREVKPT